jgi:hypothetical protein
MQAFSQLPTIYFFALGLLSAFVCYQTGMAIWELLSKGARQRKALEQWLEAMIYLLDAEDKALKADGKTGLDRTTRWYRLQLEIDPAFAWKTQLRMMQSAELIAD